MNENSMANIKRLGAILLRYVTLQLDYARLSTIAFFALIIIIGLITLVFISIGIGHWLAATIAPYTAYLFVSAFYLLLLILLIVFRNQIIFNPAARFISRLFLKAPDEENGK